jgi:hypothetical protein
MHPEPTDHSYPVIKNHWLRKGMLLCYLALLFYMLKVAARFASYGIPMQEAAIVLTLPVMSLAGHITYAFPWRRRTFLILQTVTWGCIIACLSWIAWWHWHSSMRKAESKSTSSSAPATQNVHPSDTGS